MDTPLRMRSHPGGLRLLVPATSVRTVTRRVARNVTPARLLQLVLHGDRALPPEAVPSEAVPSEATPTGGNGGPW